MTNRLDQGMAVRREVLGDAHVDRAEAAKTPFDQPFQSMITEGAWGTLWADDTITRRERSMLTLALLAATGNFEEIPMHVRACKNTGASPDFAGVHARGCLRRCAKGKSRDQAGQGDVGRT